MTEREREILKLIEENPLVSQEELAKKLGIARGSVAVHISNLLKKGSIIGKGYILPEKNYITVIGGANIDIAGIPFGDLKDYDSNQGEVSFSFGGVGRNISENLGRLGQNVEFITVLGDDLYGNEIKRMFKDIGISLKYSITAQGVGTSTYLSILDRDREMKVGISAMDIYKSVDENFIKDRLTTINSSKIVIVDTNIPEESLKFLSEQCSAPLYVDCVSTSKAERIKKFIGNFYGVKANKIEAEAISGIEIKNEKDLKKVGEFFKEKGVKELYITLGEEGLFFSGAEREIKISSIKAKVKNVTGAGDALMAGIGYSKMLDLSLEETCKNGIAAATVAVESEKTISEEMCKEVLELMVNKIK